MHTTTSKTVLALAGLVLLAGAAGAELYKIDGTHSTTHFRVKHMSAAFFQGRFNDVGGQLEFDPADPSKASISVTIGAESVDTNSERLDGHLKSPDFLSAAQFPTLSFQSTEITKTGDGTYEVAGELTIRGITKPVTTTATHVGSSEIRGKRVGFTTSLTINRRDFDVNYGTADVVGDEVTLQIDIEAVAE